MWHDMSYGLMGGGWGQGGHWLGMGLHGLFWFLLIGVIAITVIWAARATNRPDIQTASGGPSPREILDARYARGEIERDDYLVRKRNLGGPEK